MERLPQRAANCAGGGSFIENIHAPFKSPDNFWFDGLDGKAAADCYLQCVEDCAEFDIPTMVVHLPNDDNSYNALVLDIIKRIAEKAEQLGVNVALENLWNFTILAYILEQVDSPRVRFCYDCAHHYRHCPGDDLLSMYGSRLRVCTDKDMRSHQPDKFITNPYILRLFAVFDTTFADLDPFYQRFQ